MLSIKEVSVFSSERTILNPFSFELSSNQIMVIYGPSGVGKSTLFNFLSGFISRFKESKWGISNCWSNSSAELKGSGDIFFMGANITDHEPRNRKIGLVAQSDSIYPHMSTLKNIAYPLKCKGHARKSRIEKALEIAEKVQLGRNTLNVAAGTLSGGEQQRVAIAKMIAKDTKLMLLDEPFSHLDPFIKDELFSMVVELIKNAQPESGKSALIISHDCSDIKYADKVLLIVSASDTSNNVILIDIENGELRAREDLNPIQIEWFDRLNASLKSKKLDFKP